MSSAQSLCASVRTSACSLIDDGLSKVRLARLTLNIESSDSARVDVEVRRCDAPEFRAFSRVHGLRLFELTHYVTTWQQYGSGPVVSFVVPFKSSITVTFARLLCSLAAVYPKSSNDDGLQLLLLQHSGVLVPGTGASCIRRMS